VIGRVSWAALAGVLVLVAPRARAQGQAGDTAHRAVDSTKARTDTLRPSADTSARAQTNDSTPATPTDIALARVRTLVAQGETAPARALVDSLAAATPATSISYASVLYARASLATDADSAENDYRRIVVEFPASARASDALLRLAQLELARGDRQQAAAHLDRLTREMLPSQTGATFARTELQVALAYFDLQNNTGACGALTAARSAAPESDVELRNRIDYNIQRCPPPGAALASGGMDTARAHGTGAARDTAAGHAQHGAAATGAAAVTPSSRHLRAPGYTVQVAAYKTHDSASALVKRLGARGYVAHIDGTAAPFRVRIGRFAAETQADSAARALKRKGIEGFVTEAPPPKL